MGTLVALCGVRVGRFYKLGHTDAPFSNLPSPLLQVSSLPSLLLLLLILPDLTCAATISDTHYRISHSGSHHVLDYEHPNFDKNSDLLIVCTLTVFGVMVLLWCLCWCSKNKGGVTCKCFGDGSGKNQNVNTATTRIPHQELSTIQPLSDKEDNNALPIISHQGLSTTHPPSYPDLPPPYHPHATPPCHAAAPPPPQTPPATNFQSFPPIHKPGFFSKHFKKHFRYNHLHNDSTSGDGGTRMEGVGYI